MCRGCLDSEGEGGRKLGRQRLSVWVVAKGDLRCGRRKSERVNDDRVLKLWREYPSPVVLAEEGDRSVRDLSAIVRGHTGGGRRVLVFAGGRCRRLIRQAPQPAQERAVLREYQRKQGRKYR